MSKKRRREYLERIEAAIKALVQAFLVAPAGSEEEREILDALIGLRAIRRRLKDKKR